MERPVLSIRLSSSLYQRLKKEIGSGKINRFIESVVERELNEQAKMIIKQKEAFQQKLVAGYKKIAKNQKIQQEMEAWDETISDMWKNDNEH